MPSALLVNDDGIDSPGLKAVIPVLAETFSLTVVVPMTQKSWIGKASSYHTNLEIQRTEIDGFPVISLNGTPADCAVAGMYHFCETRPDLLISGINVGANVGDAYVYSSGTVGGALEGVLAGIPALSVGVEFSHEAVKQMEFEPEEKDIGRFSFAAALAGKIAGLILSEPDLSQGYVWNLNMDEKADDISPVALARPARYSYGNFLEERKAGLYHAGSAKHLKDAPEGTDMAALRDGMISLSVIPLMSYPPLSVKQERWLRRRLQRIV
jgi:5'-nucleotidase